LTIISWNNIAELPSYAGISKPGDASMRRLSPPEVREAEAEARGDRGASG